MISSWFGTEETNIQSFHFTAKNIISQHYIYLIISRALVHRGDNCVFDFLSGIIVEGFHLI
jgi:hypothetical protein